MFTHKFNNLGGIEEAKKTKTYKPNYNNTVTVFPAVRRPGLNEPLPIYILSENI